MPASRLARTRRTIPSRITPFVAGRLAARGRKSRTRRTARDELPMFQWVRMIELGESEHVLLTAVVYSDDEGHFLSLPMGEGLRHHGQDHRNQLGFPADDHRLITRTRSLFITRDQGVSPDPHLLKVTGTDPMGFASIGQRSLFSHHGRSPFAFAPGADYCHHILLRSDTRS